MYTKIKDRSDEQKKRWLLVILGFVFMIGLSLTLNNISITRLRSDVYLRWYATEKLFTEGRDLYSTLNGLEVDDIVYGQASGMKPGFYYPAHLILFTAPLTAVSYRLAHFLWTMAVQLFFFVSLWIMSREVDWPASANGMALFFVLSALALPSLQHTIWGQFNTIGMLALALSYRALQRERYGWAGIWAIGLTIKPQNYALALLFLLLWAVSDRERIRFIVGFGITAVFMWIIPAIFQPNWVFDFFGSLDQYIPVSSTIDRVWNPYQLVAITLVVAAIALFIRNRKAMVTSAAFAACLSLSLAIWGIVFPVTGMYHTLSLLIAIILLMPHWRHVAPQRHHLIIYGLIAMFIAGWGLFFLGLSRTESYGLHIEWSAFVFRDIGLLYIAAMALPFCLGLGNDVTGGL